MRGSVMTPFIKWPGGKRWLLSKYSMYFNYDFQRFIEPFLGGAAAFFYVNPSKAILSDINEELISLYKVMRDYPYDLAQEMRKHQEKHSKDYYYNVRETLYTDPLQRASRFLYLNRTCYNGMYRVNKAGKFNVPIGTKTNCIFDIDKFPEYSKRLMNAYITSCDFEQVIQSACEKDFIFADPPYTISHNQNSFIKYNEKLFTWEDQERLLKSLCLAREKGAYIISTNANFSRIKSIYKECGFYYKTIERYSVISGKVENRKKQEELLISSKPLESFNGGKL